MSKIICDICGTRYPDTAERCPICGSARIDGAATAADEIITSEAQLGDTRERVRGGRFSKSNVRKRNKNMSGYEVQREKAHPAPAMSNEYPEEEQKNNSNVVLNVLLVIVILALLAVTGYIVVEYLLPNWQLAGSQTEPSETTVQTQPPTEETQEPTIPCISLSLPENSVELNSAGQSWLLNVEINPEDTTDTLTYASSDESVATVNDEGRVTAVGEGNAVITMTCGNVQIKCAVVCSFATEPPTEPPTQAPTEPPLKDVTLKLNKTDLTFPFKGYPFTLKCEGLSNEEITWTTGNPAVATVKDGKVVAVGEGTTKITATYGDQSATCIIRCIFG